jgi:hypothetical protein
VACSFGIIWFIALICWIPYWATGERRLANHGIWSISSDYVDLQLLIMKRKTQYPNEAIDLLTRPVR